jgi:primosomal protein N' (replication factor Y)
MERRAGRYRAQLLLQATAGAAASAARQLVAGAGADAERAAVRWSLDVDPVDLY